MAMKNRKCLCDNVSYSYCPDCYGPDRLAPSWKATFCCEDCMTIWTTATKYNMSKLTKAEAKEIVSALNLKPIDQYVECVQRDLKVILAEDPKPKREKKQEAKQKAVKDIITVDVIAEIKEITNDNVVVEVEPVLFEEESTIHEVVNKTEE